MKKHLSIPVPALLLALITTFPADAALRSPFLDSLQRNFYIEACKAKLGDAVKDPACKVAPHLNAFVAWMDSTGNATDSIFGAAIKDRYRTLAGRERYAADVKGWPLIGEAGSPVTVVMYFSGTCPLCKNNFVDLEREVVNGRLRGRVKIVAKPFGNNLLNKALVTAHDMGRFSEFMHAFAVEKRRIEEDVIYEIADNLYLSRDKFKTAMESQSVAARVDAAHAEGKKNGVELVPTYFAGGRKYESVSVPRWIIDAFEYIYEADKKQPKGN
jgi:protein-disulfide isomerase